MDIPEWTCKTYQYIKGAVDSVQKPWFTQDWHGNIRYSGRFCNKGYPDEIYIDFKPLLELVEQVSDSELKDKLMDLINEMRDAYRYERDYYTKCSSIYD